MKTRGTGTHGLGHASAEAHGHWVGCERLPGQHHSGNDSIELDTILAKALTYGSALLWTSHNARTCRRRPIRGLSMSTPSKPLAQRDRSPCWTSGRYGAGRSPRTTLEIMCIRAPKGTTKSPEPSTGRLRRFNSGGHVRRQALTSSQPIHPRPLHKQWLNAP